jgi:benzodiazapine receptor
MMRLLLRADSRQLFPDSYNVPVDAKRGLMLILFFAICLGAGGLGSFFTANSVRDWYPRLRKPAGTPPAWVFGPVWTGLYVLMAVSAWLVWREYGRGARPALLIFFAQLALNVAWSGIFFGSRMPGVAFGEIVILWLAIAFNVFVFYSLLPVAALLLLPYLLWVSYAAYLNWGVWRLNRT